ILGLPRSYRTVAETVRLNCTNRKLQTPKIQYFDEKNNLLSLLAPEPASPIDINEGSLFSLLFNIACGASVPDMDGAVPNVGGTYEGTNEATYKSGGQGEQKIEVTIEQIGSDLKVNFEAAPGGRGKGVGKLAGARAQSISLQSTAPGMRWFLRS